MELGASGPRLVFVVNVDWYFLMHWLERAVAARQAGFKVAVVSNSPDIAEDPRFKDAGIEWIYWPVTRFSMKPFQLRREYLLLKTILDRLMPTMVHSITIKPNFLCGLYARFSRSHSSYIQTYPGMGSVLGGRSLASRLKTFLATVALRWSCRESDAFTFENTDDEKYFRRWVLRKPARVLVSQGAGVDLGRYSYVHNHIAPEEPLRILHAARLLRAKGLPALTAAVASLREQGYLIRLCAAGIEEPEAPDAISCDWMLDNQAEGRLDFLGHVDDMSALIPKFHVVALPTSYGEGIPRVLIEAAAMGRCIVTTNVAGCRELVLDGKTGILANDASPDSIATALLRILENRGLAHELGANARKQVESGYDKDTVTAKFLALYEAVLSK